jgi:DNA invertase Pin-like site-specific DNA recombinase
MANVKTTGNGISKLVFTILSAVAENERHCIRERVRDAKRTGLSSGSTTAAKGSSAGMWLTAGLC